MHNYEIDKLKNLLGYREMLKEKLHLCCEFNLFIQNPDVDQTIDHWQTQNV